MNAMILRRGNRLLHLAAIGVTAISGVACASKPALVTDRFVTYRVTMQTEVEVPSGERPSYLRVWHATPTVRPWSMSPDELGCLKLTQSPTDGSLLHREDKKSWHNKWQFDGPLKPGDRFECRSQFFVNSCDRRFYPSRSGTSWSDYESTSAIREGVPEELVSVATRLKASNPPAMFVRRSCEWIDKRLSYDASVPHSSTDATSTLRAGMGHCGHYYQVLRLMCDAVGLPIRRVFGLNLYAKDILSEPLYRVRPDYVNIHTWAEVHLPTEGWIEVEPSQGRKAFDIPARFIQNDPWFQNYSVWVNVDGKAKQPVWIRRSGGWTSEYGVRNLIRFQEIKLGESDRTYLPRRWVSSTGKHSVVASLIGVQGASVRLAASDGRQITISRDKLDAVSQEMLEKAASFD